MAQLKISPMASAGISCLVVAMSVTLWSCGGGGGDSTAPASGSGSPNPSPSISSISPSQASVGGAAMSDTVNGSGFVQASVVTFNGTTRPTTFVSASQLVAALSAADEATAGTFPIAVTSPSPGGGTSSSVSFVVNSAIAVSSLSPASSTTGLDSLRLTVNGSGFASNSNVQVNGVTAAFTFVSPSQIIVTLPSNVLQNAGTVAVSIHQPLPSQTGVSVNYTIVNACTVLATGLPYNPTSLGFALFRPVLDQNSVYWVDYTPGSGSNIKKVSKAGGPITVLASSLGAVNQIAVDGSNVYWTEYNEGTGHGQIRSVPTSGGTITTLASGTPAGSAYDVFVPVGIALDATYVYWGETVGLGAVRRVPKAGGTVTDIGRGNGNVNFFAIDASATNFIELGDAGSFYRQPIAGGSRQALATSVASNSTGPLLIDQTAVYSSDVVDATSGRGGSIFSVPTSGGPATYLVTKEQDPHDVAIDESFVYYPHAYQTGDVNFHFVRKVPKTGGTPTLYPGCAAGTVAGVVGVAVDSTSVYALAYNSSNAGVVFKQPK